jgi:hypothetical protein
MMLETHLNTWKKLADNDIGLGCQTKHFVSNVLVRLFIALRSAAIGVIAKAKKKKS